MMLRYEARYHIWAMRDSNLSLLFNLFSITGNGGYSYRAGEDTLIQKLNPLSGWMDISRDGLDYFREIDLARIGPNRIE
jgi:hypothetical protein